jgi:predicted metal-dependent phosphoesterase TrpH
LRPGRDRLVAELHCHTEFSSDGLITVDGMLHTAHKRGLDVVCITDHDTIEGALEFRRQAWARSSALHIVVGEERTLDDRSHLIGLFLHEPIASTRRADVIAEIHAQGGMALMPHPFRLKDGLLREIPVPTSDDVRGLDAFEIFNAKGSYADNKRTQGLLALPLGVFGGSDAHYEGDLAQCVCEFPTRDGPEAGLRAMLKSQVPFTVRGIHQRPGSTERRYAPVYYKVRPFLRVPRAVLPAAKQLYRFYRNNFRDSGLRQLEEIYTHD